MDDHHHGQPGAGSFGLGERGDRVDNGIDRVGHCQRARDGVRGRARRVRRCLFRRIRHRGGPYDHPIDFGIECSQHRYRLLCRGAARVRDQSPQVKPRYADCMETNLAGGISLLGEIAVAALRTCSMFTSARFVRIIEGGNYF